MLDFCSWVCASFAADLGQLISAGEALVYLQYSGQLVENY